MKKGVELKKVYYLGYYDTEENKSENRNHVLAASNKMTYIVSALEKCGYCVNLISASQTKNKQKYKGKTVPIGNQSELILFKTLPWGNKIRRVCSRLYSRLQLFRYILKNVNRDDTLIVYHSLAYAPLLSFLKKIKKFELVLEVEEIYADVNGSERDRKKEYKLFNMADAFVFPTELLNEKLNTEKKPHCIIYGTYQVELDRKCKFNDDKIHAVYAGTFDPRKGGAVAAAAAAAELDSNYHIHILGFGSEQDTENMKDTVSELAGKCDCEITFDGLLSGEDYIRFIQSCHIGFSTQNPDADFNATSFPSKVLSYLANGLRVVSIKIDAIERSAIGDLMYFYEENTPKAIAKAVKRVDINEPYDSRANIKSLDENFIKEISRLLK